MKTPGPYGALVLCVLTRSALPGANLDFDSLSLEVLELKVTRRERWPTFALAPWSTTSETEILRSLEEGNLFVANLPTSILIGRLWLDRPMPEVCHESDIHRLPGGDSANFLLFGLFGDHRRLRACACNCRPVNGLNPGHDDPGRAEDYGDQNDSATEVVLRLGGRGSRPSGSWCGCPRSSRSRRGSWCRS